MWFCDCPCCEFWFRFDDECQTFGPLLSKILHGLTPMGQQEPASHCSIIDQTHMEDIQWSGGN
jgi:hypothetical protein